MEHVKVSMIMPSLNVAPYIRECIESVVNQSLKDMAVSYTHLTLPTT